MSCASDPEDARVPTRREFLSALAAWAATGALAGRADAAAQQGGDQGGNSGVTGVRTTMSGPMNDDAYHPVVRPPKPGAGPSMSAGARDELEHHLHCQCGCTLDVYTCRTTDFTCPISPAMHQDVMHLVEGGYTGPEILGAFRATYGERVLMAPVREGFNWAAYIMPFVAIGGGAAAVTALAQRWRQATAERATDKPAPAARMPEGAASPEEMARLEAAIRDDSE
jgi:cytochrome c-type biogenesis protein CcmH